MKSKLLKNIINLVILFLSTEILRNILIGIPELGSLDIRIIFILIVSNYLGMKYGIASAILASISYLIQEYWQTNDISIILLNTNNWIPIVIYIVFSIIIGLKTDKNNLKISNLENEIEQRSNKEVEENEKVTRYEKEIKELNQILMVHDNSYIQVSKFMEELNNNKNSITKINAVLRKFLKNNTCELIEIEELNEKSNNLIDDSKIRTMEKDKIWVNKKLKEALPFYIAPIFISKTEKMALVVWKCEFEQMNTEYRNQVIGISEIVKYVFLNIGKVENVI